MRKRFLFLVVLLAIRRRNAVLGALIFISLITSCGRRAPQSDTGWSPAEAFPASDRSLISTLNGVPVCIDGWDYHFLAGDGTNWMRKGFGGAPNVPNAQPYTDPASARIILHDGRADFGNVRDGQFQARIVCCSVEPGWGVRTLFDRSISFSTKELLGTNTTPTCDIGFPPVWKPLGPPRIMLEEGRLGGSLILGSDVYVAYSLRCGSFYGPNSLSGTGPNQAGLLCGKMDGSGWTMLKLLDIDTFWHAVFATRGNLYFVAGVGRGLERNLQPGLRSVRLPRTPNAQPVAEIVAPHFRREYVTYAAATRDDAIHLAWLDVRHERDHPIRSILTGTPSLEGNWEVYYRSRKDSDAAWGKEVLLSGGLDFAFDPAMAVEGDCVVVVFGGYRKDRNRAVARLHPSDIFLTTSGDGGKTWRPLTRVTDNAQARRTSVRPKVVLRQGMIHLFYGDGSLTYQRRPFPSD